MESRRKAAKRQAKRARRRQRRERELAERDRRRIPYYVASVLIAAGGVAWFTFDPSTLSYWLGGVLASIPFVQLVVDRSQERGYEFPPDYGKDDGPWSGP